MQWFIFIATAILFIVTPYQRGLYFTENFYSVSVIILALFIVLVLRLFLYKEIHQIGKAFIILLLPLSYLLSLPFAESPAGAWDSVIRWTAYAAFFLFLYWSTRQLKIRKWMPAIFHLTGMWIAIHMIFADSGWVVFPNSFVVERFAGVFQYPNTFGMIMALFFLYALTMLTKTGVSYRYIAFYSVPLVIYFISFILSYSRGMLLILPMVWFIGLLLLPIKKQIEYLLFTAISTLAGLVIFQSITTGEPVHIGLLLAMVIASTGLIIGAKYLLTQKVFTLSKFKIITKKKTIRFVLPAILVLIGVAGLLDLKNEGLIYQALPEQLQERVTSISLGTSTAKERIFFIEDALQISKDAPIIGMGGESWSTVYTNYQQTPYISNKIHNGYLETLVDTGWAGLLILIGVFGYFLFNIVQSTFKEKDSSLHTAIALSLLIVFIHSFMDFNFSFGTVWLMVFWLLVMGLSFEGNKNTKNKLPIIALTLFAGLAAISLFFSFTYMQATQDYNQAKQTNSLTTKKELLESAVHKQSTNLKYLDELSNIYVLIIENYDDAEIENEINELIDKTISLEPRNPSVWLKAAALSTKLGDKERAIHYYDEALALDHFNTKLYEISITEKVNHALEDNNESYAQSAIRDFEQITQQNKHYKQKSLSAAHNSRDFHITNAIYYQASLAYFIEKDYNSIINIYKQGDESLTADLKMRSITALAYEEQGEYDKVKELHEEADADELTEYMKNIKEVMR